MKRHIVILAIWALAAGPPAAAQDRANGEKIAKTQCAVCHAVEGEGSTRGQQLKAPSFSSVAQRPNVTGPFLDTWLSRPHPDHGMPNFFLSYSEVRDVSAYILSLREPSQEKRPAK